MIRYLVALVLAFAVYSTSNAQCPPRGEGQTEGDARLEQRDQQQEDFGMEEEQDMATEPGVDREYRGQEEDFGVAPEEEARLQQQPETVYMSEDNKLRIIETPEGEVIINYNQEGLDEQELDATGRTEGYGMEAEGEAALEEAEEFEERFVSEDENLKVKENRDGEVIIKYRSEDAGMEPEREQHLEGEHEGIY
jgi:hypothetical protein